MSETITVVYEQGVLRPLTPLSLPEHARVEIQIIMPDEIVGDERQQVRQVLIEAGVIRAKPDEASIVPVSETELAAAAAALGQAGPLSALIIAEREDR
jgi:predicted DNA-binding antitoxin AbrB/MazE fold protein